MFCAYGLRFSEPAAGGVTDPPGSWPEVEVERVDAPYPAGADLVIDGERAALRFEQGWIEAVARPPFTVRVAAPTLGDDALVHPLLSVPAAAINHWLGHLSIHAGAVVHDAGAVLVTAPKEGGKSTTMAAATAAGLTVLTDDVAVLRGGSVMCGPRSIDLRPEAAAALGGRSIGVVGGRDRWRVDLGPAPAEVPVAAVVELAWGGAVAVDELRGTDRLDVLARATALGPGATSAEHLLDAATFPSYRLTRPRDLSVMPEVLERLLSLQR